MEKNLKEILTLSKEARYSSLDDVHTIENQQRLFNTYEKFMELAKDYSHCSNLNEAFELYRKDIYHHYHTQRVLERPPVNTLPGWTPLLREDKLCTNIFDQKYDNHYLQHRFEVLSRISGLELFSLLDLKHSKIGKFLGLGKYKDQENDFTFFSQSRHVGLYYHLYKEAILSSYPYEEALELLQTFARKVGTSLGELHSQTMGNEVSWPKSLTTYFTENFKKKHKQYFPQIPELDFLAMERRKLDFLMSAAGEPFKPCYTLKPSGIKNLSYDHFFDDIYFIDFSEAHLSADRFDNPIGLAADDIVYFELLLKLTMSNLSSDEKDVQILIDSFRDSYLEEAKVFPSQPHLDGLNFLFHYLTLTQHFKTSGGAAKEKDHELYPQYHYLLNWLQDNSSHPAY